jgi:hypothetical protein
MRELRTTPPGVAPGSARSPAAAVLRLQRAAGNRAVAQLMRQPAPPGGGASGGGASGDGASGTADPAKAPTVTDGRDKDEIIVTRADGTRFHVRRRKHGQNVIDHGRVRAGLCHDSRRVYLRVTWCEGTQGTIDVGANPQGALQDALNNTVQAINQRKSNDEVIKTLVDSPIEPFVEADILESEKWKVTGNIAIDINRSGVVSATGGVRGDFGWVRVGIDASDVEQQVPGGAAPGKQVTGKIEFPLGGRAPKGKQCPQNEVEILWDYECLREEKTTDTLDPHLEHHHAEPTLFAYFDYAEDRLRSDRKASTAKINTVQLSMLQDLLGQDYKVTGIDGYASPEGRRGGPGPKDVGAAKAWIGNNLLSSKRATKAKQLLAGRRGTLEMRAPLKFDPLNVPARGLGEHPLLNQARAAAGNPTDPPAGGNGGEAAELEGGALERKVIELFTNDPKEMARVTPEDAKFITDSRNGLHARAERVYEYLRRAEIHLVRDWEEKLAPVTVPDVIYVHEEDCPADVAEAAEEKWGPRIPFPKPEPSVCTP